MREAAVNDEMFRARSSRSYCYFVPLRRAYGGSTEGIVCAGEYVTVWDVKWSSGTLSDSGLVRAQAAQKYLARAVK